MKIILPCILVAAVLGVVGIPDSGAASSLPVSKFSSVQLTEPFTLVYQVNGPLVPGGSSDSTITISAHSGRLLYYQRSKTDPKITVAIYDGHETRSIGEYGNGRAQVESGFCFDQFYTMPFPGVGLPYVPIAKNVLPSSQLGVQPKKVLSLADRITLPIARADASVQRDLEIVPAPGFRNTNTGSDLYSAYYTVGSVGWKPGPIPKMLWLIEPQRNLTPLYSWIYRKHVPFEGFNLASEIEFTHFPGMGTDKRTDCTIKLVSASTTPLPDSQYRLENYIQNHARIDDFTKGSDIAFDYWHGQGSIQDQETRMSLIKSTATEQIYSGSTGTHGATGLALGLALIFGTATWIAYLKKNNSI